MTRIPIKLEKDTILEAFYEIRFKSEAAAVGSLLPGMMYSDPDIRRKFPSLEELPAAKLPSQLTDTQPNLQYAPTHRLKGETYSVQIGPRVILLNCPAPYAGWGNFKQEILAVTNTVLATGLITAVERVSLRYTNLLEQQDSLRALQKLRMTVSISDRDLALDQDFANVYVRTEIKEREFTNIVQLFVPAELQLIGSGHIKKGLMLDVDTLRPITDTADFQKNYSELVEDAHAMEKKIFFALLKEETIKSLGPVYD